MNTHVLLPALGLAFVLLYSCSSKHPQTNDTETTEATDTLLRMPVEKAEINMFVKESGYAPSFAQDLGQTSNSGVPYLETENYLKENSLVSVLADKIIQQTGVPDKIFNVQWNEEPVDTIYLDDIIKMEDGKFCSGKEYLKVAAFDRMWCEVISNAFEGVERHKDVYAICKKNLDRHQQLCDIWTSYMSEYGDGERVPHKPIIKVYRFLEFVSIYLNNLGRKAVYFFEGYSFYDIKKESVIYVVEEFKF